MKTTPQTRDTIAVPTAPGLRAVFVAGAILIGAALLAVGINWIGSFISHGARWFARTPEGDLAGIVAYGLMARYAWLKLRSMRPVIFYRPSRRDVVIFAAALVAMLLIDYAYDAVLAAYGQSDHIQAGFEHYDLHMATEGLTVAATIVSALAMIVFAPIAEELVCRALLFSALIRPAGIVFAAVISGIIFGAVHGDPIFFTPLAADGILFALAYSASRNLLVPLALHAATNAITFIATLNY